jgi:magnesium-transporting ATPase (P-type)
MDPKSIPKEYQTRLREFASSGYRILTIASKIVGEDYRTANRQDLESNLQFDGFEIF